MSERHDTVGRNLSPAPTPSRRRFMKATAGAAAAATTLEFTGPPVQRAEAVPWSSNPVVDVGAIALDYLMGNSYVQEVTTRGANYIGRRYGDTRDYSDYTGADALMAEVKAGNREMRLTDEQVMTGVANQIQAADNVAYSKGKVAVMEALNAEKSQSEAQNAMQEAIDSYFAGIQKNIVTHWNTQIEQVSHHYNQIMAHDDLNLNDETLAWDEGDTEGSPSNIGGHAEGFAPEIQVADNDGTKPTYLDGTDVDLNGMVLVIGSGSTVTAMKYTMLDLSNACFTRPPESDEWNTNSYNNGPATGIGQLYPEEEREHHAYFWRPEYVSAWQALIDRRDSVNADLSGFVADVYNEYEPGDVDLSEVSDPVTYATELSSTNDGEAFRQAQAAQLGIPTQAASNLRITVHGDEESTFETDLYTSHEPSGGEFSVGEKYDPSAWTEPLFVTYPQSDGSVSMAQLEDSFTIKSATDQDGNPVDSFGNRETNQQTADVDALREDLETLRREQIRLQEKSEESTGGGGGGGGSSGSGVLSWFSDDSLISGVPNAVPVVGGGALGYGLLSGGS